MKRWFIGAVALSVAGAVSLAGCGSGSGGTGGSADFVIMVSGGENAGAATPQIETNVLAAQAGVKVANEGGGIDGHHVRLIVSPDNDDPTQALTALREQIAKQKPNAYLVASGVNVSAAVAGVLKQNNILFMDGFEAAATNQPASDPLAFQINTPVELATQSFVSVLGQRGFKRIGILHSDDAYGIQFGKSAATVIAGGGFDVVANEQFASAALDMTPQLLALKAARPDAVVFDGFGAPVGYVLKDLVQIKWDVPVLGDSAVAATSLVTTAPPAGLIGTPAVANLEIQVLRSALYSPAAADTNKGLQTMASMGEVHGATNALVNYDGVMLLAAAAKAADSTDPLKIARELEVPAVTKTAPTAIIQGYSYSSTSHQPAVPPSVFIYVKPGILVNGQLKPA